MIYACNLWIGTVLMVGMFVEAVFGSPSTSEELATYQGLGMLMVLPLFLTAMIAAVVGAASTLRLWAHWSKEWGPVLLLVLAIVMIVTFVVGESRPGPNRWLPLAEAVYALAAFGLALRWFAAAQKRTPAT